MMSYLTIRETVLSDLFNDHTLRVCRDRTLLYSSFNSMMCYSSKPAIRADFDLMFPP
jgi:hypothetical protein